MSNNRLAPKAERNSKPPLADVRKVSNGLVAVTNTRVPWVAAPLWSWRTPKALRLDVSVRPPKELLAAPIGRWGATVSPQRGCLRTTNRSTYVTAYAFIQAPLILGPPG